MPQATSHSEPEWMRKKTDAVKIAAALENLGFEGHFGDTELQMLAEEMAKCFDFSEDEFARFVKFALGKDHEV